MASANRDREVLLVLYRATGGSDWTNKRDTDAPVKDWFGVEVNDQGRVTQLSPGCNNLLGPIPKELGALSQLEQLRLNDNQLIGGIPASLGQLSNLQVLALSNNKHRAYTQGAGKPHQVGDALAKQQPAFRFHPDQAGQPRGPGVPEPQLQQAQRVASGK